MKIYAFSQKGINKIENEDRIIIGKSIISGGLYSCELESGVIAIADGVGGNNAGFVASHFVANMVSQLKEVNVDEFLAINNDLIDLSRSKDAYKGMATTLTGIFLDNMTTVLFNVGNSRVYSIQSGKYLKQLTKDDTTLNFLLETRQISEQDVESFNRKNEITSCFGGGDAGILKIKCVDLSQTISSLLVTSDGIHDHLSVDQMEDIIAEHGISTTACEKMTEEARRCGSEDDISVIIGEI